MFVVAKLSRKKQDSKLRWRAPVFGFQKPMINHEYFLKRTDTCWDKLSNVKKKTSKKDIFQLSIFYLWYHTKKYYARVDNLCEISRYLQIASYVSNYHPSESSEGGHRNAITVVYGFVTAIHPGIAGQWVDEVGVFAASNDFSWEANLDDELNPCLPPHLAFCPSTRVCPCPRGPSSRRPRIRIKFKPPPPGISLGCLSN